MLSKSLHSRYLKQLNSLPNTRFCKRLADRIVLWIFSVAEQNTIVSKNCRNKRFNESVSRWPMLQTAIEVRYVAHVHPQCTFNASTHKTALAM